MVLDFVATVRHHFEITESHLPSRSRDLLTDPAPTPPAEAGIRRIQAVVALRLLEVMRDMDLPMEILEEEDPTQTIPRRFGLSDVVERQIRTYREDVRRRVRLTDDEIRGLFRFVIRRPDGPEVFRAVGRLLVAEERIPRWVRRLPGGLRYRALRRHARKRLKRLFGRPIGGFGRGTFVIEGRSLLFLEADPGGDACHLLSGFSEEFLSRTLGVTARVEHTLCQGLGHDLCRWESRLIQDPASIIDVPEDVRDADGDAEPIST